MGHVRYGMELALMAGFILVGTLGGWTGAKVQTPQYTATAYVVVYRMPSGLTGLISPDEANTLQSVYEAGAFQDAVMTRSLVYFPGLTPQQWRSRVGIEIVAYSPYTRVSVTSPDPKQAVALANNVSDTWALLTQQLYEDTFSTLQQRLTGRMQQAEAQVATLQATLAAEQAALVKNPAVEQATQEELAAAQQQQQQLAAVLATLTTYHDSGQSLAYTATRASEGSLQVHPNALQATGIGAVIGFTSGALLALWSLRRRPAPSRTSGRAPRVSPRIVGSGSSAYRQARPERLEGDALSG